MKNGTAIRLATAMAAITLCASTARAQEAYPAKPIQMVVTTAAGGALDLVARTLAERLSESMKQPVIIENNPAGNGSVAAAQFARATPDGHTLMMVVDSTITINPHLYKNINYDPFRDFTPISVVTRLPLVLVVTAESKSESVAGVIARANAEPGKMTYASTGLGTHLHIGMELFKLMTKTDILHIPYRATTGAMADLMGGRIDMILIGQSSAKSQVDAGKLRALGIASTERSSLWPTLPTIAEAGVPGYEASSMFAIVAPAKTPPAIVERLAQEVKKASTHEKFIAALAPQGMEIIASSPAEMEKAMKETSKKWGDVITATGTTINQ